MMVEAIVLLLSFTTCALILIAFGGSTCSASVLSKKVTLGVKLPTPSRGDGIARPLPNSPDIILRRSDS
jgi:hypothetical protein